MFRQPSSSSKQARRPGESLRGRRQPGVALPSLPRISSRPATTGTNRAAVRAVGRAGLDLAGLAVHGPRGAVDKIVKGARMHP